MNTELLNTTINEINPKTLVEWLNVTQANLDWFAVSKHQNLSEHRIRQYSFKVDWEAVKFLTMLRSCGSLTRMYRCAGGENITRT